MVQVAQADKHRIHQTCWQNVQASSMRPKKVITGAAAAAPVSTQRCPLGAHPGYPAGSRRQAWSTRAAQGYYFNLKLCPVDVVQGPQGRRAGTSGC